MDIFWVQKVFLNMFQTKKHHTLHCHSLDLHAAIDRPFSTGLQHDFPAKLLQSGPVPQ
jgi:hypothetical protein